MPRPRRPASRPRTLLLAGLAAASPALAGPALAAEQPAPLTDLPLVMPRTEFVTRRWSRSPPGAAGRVSPRRAPHRADHRRALSGAAAARHGPARRRRPAARAQGRRPPSRRPLRDEDRGRRDPDRAQPGDDRSRPRRRAGLPLLDDRRHGARGTACLAQRLVLVGTLASLRRRRRRCWWRASAWRDPGRMQADEQGAPAMRAAATRDPPMSLDGFLAFLEDGRRGTLGNWTTGCR